jgi:Na+/H+-dicarboxylate symporter
VWLFLPLLLGVAITQLSQKTASSIIRFSEAIKKICMVVILWAMMLVPYALFGLMAALLSRTRIEIFFGLNYYMRVVLLGLILLLTFYLVSVLAVTKRNPSNFKKAIKEPQLLAFSTASSAAVMRLF